MTTDITDTPIFLTSTGDFNTIPRPMQEVDHLTWWREVNIWGFNTPELRQVRYLTSSELSSLWIIRHHNAWWGIIPPRTKYDVSLGKSVEVDPSHYYRFGCIHEMHHDANLGRCLNRYVCIKCGISEVIDSSD